MNIAKIVRDKLFNAIESVAEDGVKELVEDGVLTEQNEIDEAQGWMETMAQYIFDGEWECEEFEE